VVATNPISAEVLAALRACKLWHAADDEGIAALAEGARVEAVPRGTLLAAEGDAAERLGVIVEGRARVYHLAADGREITFETASIGEPVGAIAALAGGRYPANIEAATPLTVAWIDREAVLALATAEPSVARSVIADLAGRLVEFTSVATSLTLDVPQRLAAYLFQRSLEVGATTSAGLRVDLGMSKTELASALGTVPETLSRAFARLRDDGVLEVRAKDVLVKDVGALARYGSGYSEG
jgi:CRP/FNR family transcriptional regulator, dissimilatory nitrate respiration regulator